MTLDFFYNNYNFDDIDIKKVYIENNKLYIEGVYNVYLELIANGYRPEMNLNLDKKFVFNVSYNNHKFKLPLSIKFIKNDDKYKIILNELELEVFNEIEII